MVTGRHMAQRIPAEIIPVIVSLLAAVGSFGNRLWLSAALLAVKVIIVEVAVGAEGRRVLPHHVPGGPSGPVYMHNGPPVKEVVIVRGGGGGGHDRQRHRTHQHSHLRKDEGVTRAYKEKKIIRARLEKLSAMIMVKTILLLLPPLPPLLILLVCFSGCGVTHFWPLIGITR